MITVAIAMVKDEADIIGATVGHMLTQVDHVLIADNGSTDDTRRILDELARTAPLTIVDDAEPAYRQAEKMTALAGRARDTFDADWVVPFDADEIWTSPSGRIADRLARMPRNRIHVAVAALWDHRPTALDGSGDPVARMRWRHPDRAPLHKVACRWNDSLRIQQGNHNARYDFEPGVVEGLVQIRHFPYRSAEQFARKVRNGAAAYAAGPDISPDHGGHWRAYGRILEEQGEDVLIDEVYRKWFWRADPTRQITVDGEVLPALVEDPALCPSTS